MIIIICIKLTCKNFIVKSSVGHVRDLPTKALGQVPAKKPAKELKEWSDKKRENYLREFEYQKLDKLFEELSGIDTENKIFYNRYKQGISASIGFEINF